MSHILIILGVVSVMALAAAAIVYLVVRLARRR